MPSSALKNSLPFILTRSAGTEPGWPVKISATLVAVSAGTVRASSTSKLGRNFREVKVGVLAPVKKWNMMTSRAGTPLAIENNDPDSYYLKRWEVCLVDFKCGSDN